MAIQWRTFRLATTEGWMDRASKERKEHTEWHSVVCYRQQADFVRDFLGKGRQIYVEGIFAHPQMGGQARD